MITISAAMVIAVGCSGKFCESNKGDKGILLEIIQASTLEQNKPARQNTNFRGRLGRRK